MADAVHQREKEVLDRVGGVVEHFLQPLGVLLLGGAGVARRHDGPVEAEDRQLALGDLGVEVGVALFHVRKKAVLGDGVAVVGVAQGAGQARRREAVEHRAQVLVLETGDAARLRLAEHGAVDGAAVLVDKLVGGGHQNILLELLPLP